MLPKKHSVLLVEDNSKLLRMEQVILEAEQYEVFTAMNGNAALEIFNKCNPDLVLLDIVLPDIDGYSICSQIRAISQVPIIMVSAKGEVTDKVRGLNCGADDYITKPFSSLELAARIKAVQRRSSPFCESKPVYRSGNLVIDCTKHMVTLNEREVNLTAVEYEILCYLAQNAGQVVSHQQLMEAVWGHKQPKAHVLSVNMTRLRHKLLEDSKNPKYIETKSRIGYRFKP